MADNSMVIFERAAVMLAKADTIQKAKELKDMAVVAGEWAKRKGMGEAAIFHCRSYALEAERRMGEMLLETERAKGKLKQNTAVTEVNSGETLPTLEEIGISRRESSIAQAVAALPKTEFEAIKSGKETKARALNNVRRKKKKKAHEARVVEAVKNPRKQSKGPFDLILADPPWRYDFEEAKNREIENQYSTATLEDIFKHSPASKKDSILFLWATAPKLEEAIQVMNAWDFSYRTCAVWDKQKIGMGYWFRIQHELLLVGVKGKPGCTPECERISSVFSEARGKHSVKPVCIYEWIERSFPDMDKLEMYCRSPRPGWSAFGNEV